MLGPGWPVLRTNNAPRSKSWNYPPRRTELIFRCNLESAKAGRGGYAAGRSRNDQQPDEAVASEKKFPPILGKKTSFVTSFTKLAWVPAAIFACLLSAQAQAPNVVAQPIPSPSASQQSPLPDQQTLGSISGTLLDATGSAIPGAKVSLMRANQRQHRKLPPGPTAYLPSRTSRERLHLDRRRQRVFLANCVSHSSSRRNSHRSAH